MLIFRFLKRNDLLKQHRSSTVLLLIDIYLSTCNKHVFLFSLLVVLLLVVRNPNFKSSASKYCIFNIPDKSVLRK